MVTADNNPVTIVSHQHASEYILTVVRITIGNNLTEIGNNYITSALR